MSDLFQDNFFNPSRGDLTFEEVTQELIGWMKEKPEKEYEVIVGCDSASETQPDFPVAIVLLRVGEGGRYFLKQVSYDDKEFHSVRERILQEVVLSCDLALKLRENLKEKVDDGLNYNLRYIHADIGKNGKTKDMIKEVVGLIKGNGFMPKIKPEAYAASSLADRYS